MYVTLDGRKLTVVMNEMCNPSYENQLCHVPDPVVSVEY